jgi:hypothetical protein
MPHVITHERRVVGDFQPRSASSCHDQFIRICPVFTADSTVVVPPGDLPRFMLPPPVSSYLVYLWKEVRLFRGGGGI